MKLLAVGDIHLGRPPAALPEDLLARARELGPEAAWARAVDAAIDHAADAVLLAGDVVDRGRDFFVAYGDLRAGVERLAEAGIPVIAVAGNHDTRVLPRLADEIDALHLLGRGGRWELKDLGPAAVLGWSFPAVHVHENPLDSFPGPATDKPVIGLLHCDRDQPGSPYAPVTGAQLEQAPVAAWLLGHIHQPDDLGGDRPLGYLGSVNALRASETGPRGPWLVEVGAGVRARQLPLAPLRYESLTVDAGEIESVDQLFSALLAAARERIGQIAREGPLPDALGLRLRLEGRTRLGAELADQAGRLLAEARAYREDGVEVFVHRIEVSTLPEIDLARLAERTDPAGLLARDLLTLEDAASPGRAELIAGARREMAPIAESREFRGLEPDLDDEAVAERLIAAGRAVLSRLIDQRGEAG